MRTPAPLLKLLVLLLDYLLTFLAEEKEFRLHGTACLTPYLLNL